MTAYIALGAWIANVAVGAMLLATWLRKGGRATGRSHIRSWLVFGHMASAVTGLGLWITYLAAGRPAWLAWFTWGFMFLINVLGDAMFIPWLKRRKTLASKLESAVLPVRPAELSFTLPVV